MRTFMPSSLNPGIWLPIVKYVEFDDERSFDVPIPY